MNTNFYPYLPRHITLRRYEEVHIYDLKIDESYIIDEEAYSVLKLVDGHTSYQDITDKYPKEKQGEVIEALETFQELGVILDNLEEVENVNIINLTYQNLPEINPFNPPYLKFLMINLTEKCNLACKHCYITDKNLIDFPLEELKKIIQEFNELQGIKLVLTGGEPFLYSKLKELLEFLIDIPLQKIFLSNGVLIKDYMDTLNLIKENNIEVYISIDGLKESHNDFRDANCFDDSIEGIKLLLDNGIDVSINTMVHKQNLKDFDGILKLIKSLGTIKNWAVDIPTFDDNTPQEILDKYKIIPEEGGQFLKDYGWGVIYESEGEPVDYACGPYLMAIDVTGVITKCGFFTEESPGNIFKLGLKKSWEAIQKRCSWNIYELACEEKDCEYLKECRGGCRYRAFKDTRNIMGIDLYKCWQFGKLK